MKVLNYWVRFKSSIDFDKYIVKTYKFSENSYFQISNRVLYSVSDDGKNFDDYPLLISGKEYHRGDMLPKEFIDYIEESDDIEEIKLRGIQYYYEDFVFFKYENDYTFKNKNINIDKFKSLLGDDIYDIKKFNIMYVEQVKINSFSNEMIDKIIKRFFDYNPFYDKEKKTLKFSKENEFSVTCSMKTQVFKLRVTEQIEDSSFEFITKLKKAFKEY